jgi:hypothetical protein
VKHICSTNGAFAAITEENLLIAWGDNSFGGVVPENLKKVQV